MEEVSLPMTPESQVRLDIARRVAAAHKDLPGFAACFATGSAAEGTADDTSDLDMSVLFHALPPRDLLDGVRQSLDPNPPKWIIGSYEEGEFAVSIRMEDIEVQYGCATVASMDEWVDKLLAGEMLRAPEQKIGMGMAIAIPMGGDAIVNNWKLRLAEYTHELKDKMIQHHLPTVAIWRLWPRIENRDAELWARQECVEFGYRVAGMLAGLNGVWHSDFQFKRLHKFCESLRQKPENLYERLLVLASAPIVQAVQTAHDLARDMADVLQGREGSERLKALL